MAPDLTTAKSAIDVAKGLAPLLHRAFRPLKKAYAISEALLRGNYEDYVAKSHEALSQLCTILDPTTNLRIEDVYVPLTLKAMRDGREVEVSGYPDRLFRQSPHTLVIDTAGMGKSTLSRFIFLKSTEPGSAKKLPIFVELRRMKANEDLAALIARELALFKGAAYSEDVLLSVLSTGQFLLLLDGVDELPDAARPTFVDGLRKIIAKCAGLDLWITSRNDPILTEFPTLERWRVSPLNRDSAYQLIHRYERNREIANQLVGALKSSEIESIETFLGTPLLVVLLVSSYEQKQFVPVKRSNFYYQVFDALFERHDASKGGLVRPRQSSLTIDQFYSVLRAFCFMLIRDGTVEIDQVTFENRMGQAKRLLPQLTFSSESVKADLLHAVPLMTLDGGKLRFAHKSMIDFFAAAYVTSDLGGRQSEFLEKLYDGKQMSRLSEMLRFCADLDFLTFRRTILRKLAAEIVEFEPEQRRRHAALPPTESTERFIRASFFTSHAAATMKEPSTTGKPGARKSPAISVTHIPDGDHRTHRFDSVTIDIPRPDRILYTQFRNAYTLFAILKREQTIPFLVKFVANQQMHEDSLAYLFEPMAAEIKDEPFVGRELTLEDIQLIGQNDDLGLLASRCHILPDFVVAAQFLVDLDRESNLESLVLEQAFSEISDRPTRPALR